MRILFLHEVGYLSKPIFEMHEFPELLALEGNEVFFIDFEEKGRIRSPFPRKIRGRVYENAQITLQHSNFVGGGILSRIFTAVIAPVILLLTLRTCRPDVVVTYAVPTLGWQAAIICRLLGIPIVFRSIDISHELRGGSFSAFIRLSEKALLWSATAVSTHNQFLARQLRDSIGSRALQLQVHLPPLAVPSPDPQAKPVTRDELGFCDDDVVVVFMGTLFKFSGVVDLARQFLDTRHPSLRLLIMGEGELAPALGQLISTSENASQVQYLGFVPHSLIWNYFLISDIAVNPFNRDLVTESALPNKLLQYQAAGLPVVSSELGGAKSVIGEGNGVVWCSGLEEILAALNELGHDEAMRFRVAERAKSFVARVFGVSSGVNKQVTEFQEFLDSLASAGVR